MLYDGHGSTRQLTQYSAGAVSIVDSFSYDGYGVLLQDDAVASSNPGYTPTQATGLLYAGEQFDVDAQQYYPRARYYDPLNGRFNRMDTYGHKTALRTPGEGFEKPTVGFEPTTPGLQNQSLKNITTDKTKTCETSKEQLTPQLTPKSPKQPKIDTSELPSDLAEIVAVWPELPEYIKAAIKALIESSGQK